MNKKTEKVVNVSEAKFAKMQKDALDGFMNDFIMESDSSNESPNKKMTFGKTGKRSEPNWAKFEDSGPVNAGDLEFNDLEIAFDKR